MRRHPVSPRASHHALVCAAFLLAYLLAGCATDTTAPMPAEPSAPADVTGPVILECVPYARALSGISLTGDAADWWWKADGLYARSATPVVGAVLVFGRSGRLSRGHLAVVSQVISDREIRVSHANWVRHYITTDQPVVDVSADNDWSMVRVWWPPAGQLGATAYAADGFILPDAPVSADQMAAAIPQVIAGAQGLR